MKIETKYLTLKLKGFVHEEVSRMIDHLLVKNLITFPRKGWWWENGVYNENFKTGDEFGGIIARAIEMKLDDEVKKIEQYYSELKKDP